MTDEELTDLIADAITDSLDMDWTANVGAAYVLTALREANVLPVWRTIDSAPRELIIGHADGMTRLLLNEGGKWMQVGAKIEEGWFVPKFWQPLPTPPENVT